MDDLSPIFGGVARDEMLFSESFGVNLLMIGLDHATRNLIDSNLLNFKQPTTAWKPGERLVLPKVETTRTLILHEVGSLPLADQQRLMVWLEGAMGHIRVVCTTSESLMPHVTAGTFIEALYYRLNTMSIVVPNPAELLCAPADASRGSIS